MDTICMSSKNSRTSESLLFNLFVLFQNMLLYQILACAIPEKT